MRFKILNDILYQWSLFSFFNKKLFDEFYSLFRILGWNFGIVWLFSQDSLFNFCEDLLWSLSGCHKRITERVFICAHIVKKYSNSPCIYLSSSNFGIKKLRRFYLQCTYNIFLIRSITFVKHSWLSKISQLCNLTIKHNVFAMKIIMNNVHPV